MRKRTVKMAAMAVLASGCMFQFVCLGDWFNMAWRNLPGNIATEWLTDNDAIFDLFEDGNVTTE